MQKISKEDRIVLSNCVTEYEKKTLGEIVPYLAHSASDYLEGKIRFHLLFVLLGAFAYFAYPLNILHPRFDWIFYQTGAWIISLALLNLFPRLKIMLLSHEEIQEKINTATFNAFYSHGLHRTHAQTGVLIAVYQMERRVKILADQGIHEKVEEHAWDKIVTQMIRRIQLGSLSSGILLGIQECGKLLQEKFPAGKKRNPNELKNSLIFQKTQKKSKKRSLKKR